MTEIPVNELRALGIKDFRGLRILELGNKKNSSGLYRDWYQAKGGRYLSTDINGQDGAVAWDIREPMPIDIERIIPVDIVTNFGFTEHVQDRQAETWANIHAMVHPAFGRLCCVLPAPGGWKNHGKAKGFPGTWYPHPLFFKELARLNMYDIDDLWYDPEQKLVGCRLVRLPDSQKLEKFTFPTVGMYDNIHDQPKFEGILWDAQQTS
jgi:hypothetical protein